MTRRLTVAFCWMALALNALSLTLNVVFGHWDRIPWNILAVAILLVAVLMQRRTDAALAAHSRLKGAQR